MLVNKEKLGLYALAWGTCLVFLNPIQFHFEIFPYFLVALIFLKIDLRVIAIGFLIMLVSLFWIINDHTSRAIIDAGVLVSMLFGASMFHLLKHENKQFIANIFFVFLVFNFFISIFQFVFIDFQSFVYNFFSGDYRPNVLEAVRARNAAITGLGPEPAYTAALIVGLGTIISAYKPEKLIVLLIVIATLILLRSVTGFLYGFIYLIFFLSRQNNISLYLLKLFKFWYLLIPLTIASIYISIDQLEWFRLFDVTARLINFLSILFESGNLLLAEEQFSSDRIVGIYKSFSSIYLSEYGTGFSPAAAINFLFGTSLISIILAAMLALKKGRGLSYLIALTFVFVGGPKLIWPIFYFGLFGTENIQDAIVTKK